MILISVVFKRHVMFHPLLPLSTLPPPFLRLRPLIAFLVFPPPLLSPNVVTFGTWPRFAACQKYNMDGSHSRRRMHIAIAAVISGVYPGWGKVEEVTEQQITMQW